MAEIASLILGALLGAFFGYMFAVRQEKRRDCSSRDLLLQVLHEELSWLPSLQSKRGESNALPAPLMLRIPDYLFSGKLLDPDRDVELIVSLLTLQTDLYRYNQLVNIVTSGESRDHDVADKAKEFLAGMEVVLSQQREFVRRKLESLYPELASDLHSKHLLYRVRLAHENLLKEVRSTN